MALKSRKQSKKRIDRIYRKPFRGSVPVDPIMVYDIYYLATKREGGPYPFDGPYKSFRKAQKRCDELNKNKTERYSFAVAEVTARFLFNV